MSTAAAGCPDRDMATTMRTFDAVVSRAAEFESVVPPAYEDNNGHLTSTRYAELHDRATDALFRRLGYPRADAQDGVFNIQSATRHLNEVLVGHRVSGHVVLMDFDGRFFHVSGHLVNHSTSTLATSFEVLLGNVGLRTTLPSAPAQSSRRRPAWAGKPWTCRQSAFTGPVPELAHRARPRHPPTAERTPSYRRAPCSSLPATLPSCSTTGSTRRNSSPGHSSRPTPATMSTPSSN